MSEVTPSFLYQRPEEIELVPYELLVGHRRTNGSEKTDDQLRMEYVTLTDELIRQMTEGVRVTDSVTRERVTRRPDAVVWLDKSARPVSWLTKDLWAKLAPSPNSPHEVPPMPPFYYVNIDRKQWLDTLDPQDTGQLDVSHVDPSIVRSLRSVFVGANAKLKDEAAGGLTEVIDAAPAALDDKVILIVDEVRTSGRTLDIARRFFERAFPTAQFATTHWMGGVTQVGSATANADLPVWYREDAVTGRGVGDRDANRSAMSASVTARLGRYFLSGRLDEPDSSSSQLRRELETLANDPNVLIVPSIRRNDFDERAESLNGMSWDQFIVAKRAIDPPQ